MLPFFNQLQRFLVNFKNPSIVSNSNTAQKVMMTNGYTETYGGSATTGRGDMNFATRRLETIEQVFVFNGTKQQAFTNLLPAYARVIEAWLNYDTALAYTTATNMGVGGTTTLAGAVLTTGTLTAKNTVTQAKPLASAISGVADNTNSATPTTLYLSATNTGGTATGTVVGTVRANVIYELTDPPFPHP